MFDDEKGRQVLSERMDAEGVDLLFLAPSADASSRFAWPCDLVRPRACRRSSLTEACGLRAADEVTALSGA
jgi:hypothetical protein